MSFVLRSSRRGIVLLCNPVGVDPKWGVIYFERNLYGLIIEKKKFFPEKVILLNLISISGDSENLPYIFTICTIKLGYPELLPWAQPRPGSEKQVAVHRLRTLILNSQEFFRLKSGDSLVQIHNIQQL